MKLSDLIENPDNPQTVTDEDFAKLVEAAAEKAAAEKWELSPREIELQKTLR